uniref:2',3'-cyclic-nucleotide 3'-phosphodiesterase n=1 Tax=Callorhinchus milii TaxID=7868 RepID=V9KJG0_CALMI
MLLRSALKLTKNLSWMMGASKSKPKLSYPFLEDVATISAVKDSKVLFILRGLPGSDKSTIANNILKKYESLSVVLSAESHQISPFESSTEGSDERYAKLDEEIQRELKAEKGVVVVDDTHHTRKRLNYLFDSAKEFCYTVVIVQANNECGNQCSALASKNHPKASKDQLEAMKDHLEQPLIPYYFGWFLTRVSAKQLDQTGEHFLEQLAERREFLEEFVKYIDSDAKENFNLQDYFQKKPSILHCTTKFCNFGQEPNCETYIKTKGIEEQLSKAFHLKITDLFITPRTVGARVVLTEKQLCLWPTDENESNDKEGMKLPLGSRSHITLACAPHIKAVQTGRDLLEFLQLEACKAQPSFHTPVEGGELLCYDEGRWILHLSKHIEVKSIFSGSYHNKTAN